MEEIGVEAATVERRLRVGPLGHHEGARVLLVHEGADLVPEDLGALAAGGEELVVAGDVLGLDERARHVRPEAVGAHVHPEPQDALQFLLQGEHVRVVDGEHPGLGGAGEAEVERGLAPEEVAHELAVAPAIALDEGIPVGFRRISHVLSVQMYQLECSFSPASPSPGTRGGRCWCN